MIVYVIVAEYPDNDSLIEVFARSAAAKARREQLLNSDDSIERVHLTTNEVQP